MISVLKREKHDVLIATSQAFPKRLRPPPLINDPLSFLLVAVPVTCHSDSGETSQAGLRAVVARWRHVPRRASESAGHPRSLLAGPATRRGQ